MGNLNRKLNRKWCGVELDVEKHRKRFRRALMKASSDFGRGRRCSAYVVTPYWKSDFNDWLIYDCTLGVAGCVCTEKDEDHCVFEVDSTGCQEEGICMRAYFYIPTSEFSRKELKEIVPGCGEYYPRHRKGTIDEYGKLTYGFTYGPFDKKKYITKLEWWYDAFEDQKGEESE